MADDEDLRLNTLNRFSKRSPRLTLEERGSCEVPAGCGGVVLRWLDPDRGQNLVFRAAYGGRIAAFLDGQLVESGRALVPYGDHVLALRLEADAPAQFLFAVTHDDPDLRTDPARALLVTGGPLRASATDPGAGWEQPGFDDAGWAAPAISSTPVPEKERWRVESLRRWGAAPLDAPARLWLRGRFRVVRS
jgi:hypothetical protein